MFHVKHQLKIFRLNYIPISPNNHSDISKINIPILVVYRFSSKNSVTNGILTNPLNRFTAEKATEIQKIAKTAPRTIPNSLSANFRILIFEIALFKSFFKRKMIIYRIINSAIKQIMLFTLPVSSCGRVSDKIAPSARFLVRGVTKKLNIFDNPKA